MHIHYSTGLKFVSSWMNKYDFISNGPFAKGENEKKANDENQERISSEDGKRDKTENQEKSTSENEKKANTQNPEESTSESEKKGQADNHEMITSENENQGMVTGDNQETTNIENQETVSSENQENATSEGQEKGAAASVVSRFSNSSSSQDSASLPMEDEEDSEDEDEDEGEGEDENSAEEAPVDYSRSIGSETATSKASTSSESSVYHSVISAINFPSLFNMWKKSQTKLQALSSEKSAPKSFPKLTRRKTKRIRRSKGHSYNATLVDADLCHLKAGWKNFALAELQAATDNFSQEKLIGQGGYAEVYKGQLEDGQFVAIKRLTRGSIEEMTTDYLSELGIIVHVDHPNIAKMIGYGVEGGMHLVLELSPHGSLASLLYGPKEKLNWGIRYKIAVGTAAGICYLHESCQRRIIHKDIKAANILLTEDFQPQISDFGLAKWLPDKWTHHTVSKIEGTFGYIPPEFFIHGTVDEKTDIYAYGVLVLELITGRQALDSSQNSLVLWAKPLLKKSSMKELVDPCLDNDYNTEQLTLLLLIASACINQTSACRPKMSKVVQVLNGDEVALAQIVKENQSLRRLQRTYSERFFNSKEFNSANFNETNVLDQN